MEQKKLHRVRGATERRPGLDALMADARRGAFEVVVVFRFDRFAWRRETVGTGSGGVPVFRNRLHFPPGGAGHLDPNGRGDVRDHRDDGATGKEHPV